MCDILNTINCPQDLKELPRERLQDLAAEIREFLIQSVSTGGISRPTSGSSS